MEAYYKKIVYKKNAFEDLKTFVKLNYNKNNILLISTKSIQPEDVTNILNSLFGGSESVEHYVARENFSIDELDELNQKINKGAFNLIVSFGGGKCCDVSKFFSHTYGIPYVVCPTVATSLAYFTDFCVNPYDSTKSFYASMPQKIFIQEKIIKEATCLSNINGLSLLHSLRCVYVEGMFEEDEKQSYIYLGLEKLFSKLEYEQINILMCNEDSNLILMDLLIDFGFFIGMLDRENFYLFNMYLNYLTINQDENIKFSGVRMMLCSKIIMSIINKYFTLNSTSVIEKTNYANVASIINKYGLTYKYIKNDAYFKKMYEKVYLKVKFLKNKDYLIKLLDCQISKISEFCSCVKNVYKYGIEVFDSFENIFSSLYVTPFIYKGNYIIDMMANSGILNCLSY